MKKLNKLKINEISKNNLMHKEMKELIGGENRYCRCSCYWEDQGGASVKDNCLANDAGGSSGYISYQGNNDHYCRDGEFFW
jgi:natural product precursor